eukprot:CAMPEP_0114999678 /NCGR_PEP_ID=MMETSP0216-20121206/16291_1 /TAXON_ID=223996 /ORGANISM="Protocruzia adherens, Strain Boccale" /LENGTH=64 /DNA_ID=CAMNT_0002364603 /DNA_START=205 /DNA_END=395 /DNA_ORIENTATION=-
MAHQSVNAQFLDDELYHGTEGFDVDQFIEGQGSELNLLYDDVYHGTTSESSKQSTRDSALGETT